MKKDPSTNRAMVIGNRQAMEVLAERDKALKIRAAVLRKHSAVSKKLPSTVSPKLLAAVGGPEHNGVLVAEGDSWFDYPGPDILSLLERNYGYEVEDVASPGDRIQDMAYNEGQLEKFTRKIEKVIRGGNMPKAILLSGGGNDVAGKEFAVLLNHASAPKPGLNIPLVKEIVEERIKDAYVTIISAVTQVCKKRLGQRIPILLHGYDYAVPDGRGYLWFGPWLEPGFREKGYQNMNQRIAMVQDLIDRLNNMLLGVSKISDFKHVSHVDFRTTLPNDSTYKKWWDNELHPTDRGFELVAKKFANAVEAADTP